MHAELERVIGKPELVNTVKLTKMGQIQHSSD